MTHYTRYTFPDGKTSNERTKAGEVDYSKPVTHASEDLGGTRSEAIMVELKEPAAGTPANVRLDPIKLDPEHYKVVIDNDQVRVLRANYGPGPMRNR